MRPLARKQLAANAAVTEKLPEVVRLDRSIGRLSQAGVTEPFRLAMRELAAGVSVVTTGQGAARAGFTATSVTSLSMAPPALLVCVQRGSATLSAILENGIFAVNLLSADQRSVADRFSGRNGIEGSQRFAGSPWQDGTSGVPLLQGALAAVECTVAQASEWHTHAVIFANVVSARISGEGAALVYWRGDYAAPYPLEQVASCLS